MPRKGCQTCKLRHIKCDDTKPTCQPCLKSRRICIPTPLVKQTPHFSIHAEDLYASGSIKRPRGPRPRSLTRNHLPLVFGKEEPYPDIQSRATTYYLNYYLHELTDIPTVSACMSECIVTWASSHRQSRIVDLAISALALAIFSRTNENPLAARQAVSRYTQLLRITGEKIRNEEIGGCRQKGGEETDEFLLVIVLMAWYEATVHQPPSSKHCTSYLGPVMPSQHSWSHHDGALAILKAWSSRSRSADTVSVEVPKPSNITKQARRGLLRSSLMRNLSVPQWIQDGRMFGEIGLLDTTFDSLLVRVVNLRHSFKHLRKDIERTFTSSTSHQKVSDSGTAEIAARIEVLITEAQKLDIASEIWKTEIPPEWMYTTHLIPKSWPQENFHSNIVHICTQHSYAAVWTQYFALKLLISSTLLGLHVEKQRATLRFFKDRRLGLSGVDLGTWSYWGWDEREGEGEKEGGWDGAKEKEEEEVVWRGRLKRTFNDLVSILPFSLGFVGANNPTNNTTTTNIPAPQIFQTTNNTITPSLALPTIFPLTTACAILSELESESDSDSGPDSGADINIHINPEPGLDAWFRNLVGRLGRVLGDGALVAVGAADGNVHAVDGGRCEPEDRSSKADYSVRSFRKA